MTSEPAPTLTPVLCKCGRCGAVWLEARDIPPDGSPEHTVQAAIEWLRNSALIPGRSITAEDEGTTCGRCGSRWEGGQLVPPPAAVFVPHVLRDDEDAPDGATPWP